MSKKQHEIRVLCPTLLKNQVHFSDKKVEYIEIPSFSLMNRLRFPKPFWLEEIKRNLQWADVVHVHCPDNPFAFLFAVFGRLLNKPLIVTVLAYADDLRHHRKLVRIFGILPTAFQTVSIWAADEIHVESLYDKHKLNSYAGKIVTIPPGISDLVLKGTPSPDIINLIKNRIDYHIEQKIVLYLGRIHEAKGIKDAVLAVSVLKRKGQVVKLVMAGPDNGFLDETMRTVNVLGLSKEFVYLGRVTEMEKLALLDLTDVLIIPSMSDIVEAFSIVASEAWARKKLVVAYAVGALRLRVQTGKNGYLAKSGDYQELALRISDALSSPEVFSKPSDVLSWDEVSRQFERSYCAVSRLDK